MINGPDWSYRFHVVKALTTKATNCTNYHELFRDNLCNSVQPSIPQKFLTMELASCPLSSLVSFVAKKIGHKGH
jgi:hypothetical protein